MSIRMKKYVLFLLSSNLHFGFMYRHEKPVPESIWKEPCVKQSTMLNDCNWCRCTDQSRYNCDARVCREVDMFGHFNDAIRDIDVGMEGHGVWRTGQAACEPGVHYQREELLCICTEDGGWPSPICRDTFRILHSVEIVTEVKTFKDQECTPTKLYLIGCNVCFCPADGVPNPKFCTRKECSKDDPVFDTPKGNNEVGEVYVKCNLNTKYKLGCKNCVCLRNNRLLCDNCTSTYKTTQCSNRAPGEMFNVDCNTCQCDEKGLMYCTVKRCLKNRVNLKDIIDGAKLDLVDTPITDISCVEGTKYKKECNTCYCFKKYGLKHFGCTIEKCSKTDRPDDCVDGSVYEMNCLICQCGYYNGKKMEICHEDPKCKIPKSQELLQLTFLSGYCEPLHLYKKDCNTCECLPDGKNVRCTSNFCQKNRTSNQNEYIAKPIAVEIVPVMKDIGQCSSGTTFKIDCNMCFCLSNGDVVCTTENCKIKNN